MNSCEKAKIFLTNQVSDGKTSFPLVSWLHCGHLTILLKLYTKQQIV